MNGQPHVIGTPVPKRALPPGGCPWCGGEPHVLKLPPEEGTPAPVALACKSCGIIGPAQRDLAEATAAWNTRSSDPASLAFDAKTDPETVNTASVVMDISKKLYANQMGPVRAFVLIMFSPDHGGRVGLHAHALDAASAGQMCADASKAFLRNVNQVREITPSGIIIP